MGTGRSTHKGRRLGVIAGAACASAVLGAVIVGHGAAGPVAGPDPITGAVITPDGGPPTFAVLRRLRSAEDRLNNAFPPEVLAGINVAEARFARRFRGVRIFVAPRLEGPDICVIMINRPWSTPEAAINCAPPEWLATGRQAMKMQGAWGESAIYAGIVPDGVESLSVGDAASNIESNVMVLGRENGRLGRSATYVLGNGRRQAVQIPVDDSLTPTATPAPVPAPPPTP